MKKALFGLVMMVVCGSALAQLEAVKEPIALEPVEVEKTACYYVYLARENTDLEKGDIVDVISCEKINPPPWDFKNFTIIKMMLTKTRAYELKLPLFSGDPTKDLTTVVKKARYNINDINLQKELTGITYDETEIKEYIIDKSAVLSVSK